MAPLDDLVTRLRADGAVDSEGRFTLDREQARSKMQQFQLADARLYVLELVQAAVLRGATRIRFDIDADDMRMRFDGQPFTADELDDLYGSVFAEGTGPAFDSVRQLAVAFNAAQNLNLAHIEVRSGGVTLTIRPGREDSLQALEPAQSGTTIHVRRRFAAGVVLDFFRNVAGRLDEERYLRERCRHASIPIDLEGKVVSTGLSGIPGSLVEVPFSGPQHRGVMALVPDAGVAQLRLVKAGVWIDDRHVPECGTRLVAVVEGDALRKDVSQARIVSDRALTNLLAALKTARWQLWHEAMRASDEGRCNRGEVSVWLREQVLAYATPEELRTDPHAVALAERLCWPDCRTASLPEGSGRKLVSLRTLLDLSRHSLVGFTSRTFDHLEPDDEPVILVTEDELGRLRRLLPGLRDRTKILAREQQRELARRQWRSRVGEPSLPEDIAFVDRVHVQHPGVRAEIGVDAAVLTGGPQHPMRAMLFKDGCLLGRIELDVRVPYLWLAVEADFEPTHRYDDAVRDERFVQVLLTSLAQLCDAIPEVHEIATGGHHEPAVMNLTRSLFMPARSQSRPDADPEAHVRGFVKRWLALLLLPDRRRSMLRTVGVTDELAAKWDDEPHSLSHVLAPARLSGEDAHPLADLPLFLDFAGHRPSFRELADAHARDGALRYLPWATDIAPLDGLPGVLRLGPTDMALIESVFGPSALVCWQDQLETERTRARHLAKPLVDLDDALTRAHAQARHMGLDPELWAMPLTARRGFVALALGTDDLEEIGHCRVEVHREGRHLSTLQVDLGVSGVEVFVEDDALQPTPDWLGVVDDTRRRELVATLRDDANALMERICQGFDRLPAIVREQLGKILLLAIATDEQEGHGTARARYAQLPIVPTVDDRAISLADAEAIVGQDGRLLTVDDDHPTTAVDTLVVVRIDATQRRALTALLGPRVLHDARTRLQRRGLEERLAAHPRVDRVELSASEVLVRETFERPGVHGEVGLSRTRSHGLQLRLCTAGRLVGRIDRPCPLPIDAILSDDELPLTSSAELEEGHGRVRNHARNCSRRAPELVIALTQMALNGSTTFASEGDFLHARELLLRHAMDERDRDEARRGAREKALQAVLALPLVRDIWGRPYALQELVELTGGRSVDVLERMRPDFVPPPGETAASIGRLILTVDPIERQCLERFVSVRVIDDRWHEELDALEQLRRAPPVVTPNLETEALAHRCGTVAEGLEALLWLPRDHDPLELGSELRIVFANGEREIHRDRLLPFLPCSGIVRGAGLRATTQEVTLSDRQRASLERQVVALYDTLADHLRRRRFRDAQRVQAELWLARAAVELEEHEQHPAIGRLGNRVPRLRTKLDDPVLVSPMFRDAVLDVKVPPATSSESRVETPAPEAPQDAPRENTAHPSPAQALLAEIHAELHWARARHQNLLDELGMASLTIAQAPGQALAVVVGRSIVVRSDHPIVARLLTQERFDPFDLAFVLVAIYSLLNDRAPQIRDDDERAFIHQLSEALVLRTGTHRQP